ncbi:bergaptol O-methyltransferase-like [Gossypium hirsutum]|uniref:Bergaptol O-methyltransferase-like n=1 Tax=Gossypium hirsutum TaxID=3635 RepID=A0A1U8MUS5_GOSHI|nr:bergaptol O-methyltransferase-like [Gossypium hirsutum]
MNQVLGTYNGFEGVSQVVDAGGGIGINLKLFVSKYPQLKGINFDLPQVIKDAHCAEVIFMKSILHNWGNDRCMKLLKSMSERIGGIRNSKSAKERTKQELKTLAKQAGFSSLKIIRHAYNHCVMEI